MTTFLAPRPRADLSAAALLHAQRQEVARAVAERQERERKQRQWKSLARAFVAGVAIGLVAGVVVP